MKKFVSKSFFDKPTKTLAKDLLGTYLYTEHKHGITIGKIVETEAYLFKNDPACHAHKGKTKRNEMMFEEAGKAYIYLCYGMYHLFNVVSGKKGIGEAVLIRALEPIEGIELMKKRRNIKNIKQLCSGPGKLVLAMGIHAKHNGICLRTGPIKIAAKKNSKFEIQVSPRIGISQAQDLLLRFTIKGNKFLSK